MKILMITGGNSSEREVALISTRNILEALKLNGHDVTLFDFNDDYEELKKHIDNCDLVYPAFAGEIPEGGPLHKFLSSFDKPIVGTRNYKGLDEAWHKISLKKFCDANDILTPAWKLIQTRGDILEFGFPCVVKSSTGGSSIEVFILKNLEDLNSKHDVIFKYSDLFVEKYMEGTEITVGILNGKTLPIIEIIPPRGEFFSYENKYDPGKTQEIPFAPSVPQGVQEEAKKISLKVHNAFNLGTYSRTDFIINDGHPYLLEINTIPGMTKGSLFPKQAKAAGLEFSELVEILIKSAK